MADFPDPDFDGEGMGDPGEAGVKDAGDAAGKAMDAALEAELKMPQSSVAQLDEVVQGQVADISKTAVTDAIDTVPEKGPAGRQIKTMVGDVLADPAEAKGIHDSATGKAIKDAGGDPASVTADSLKTEYKAAAEAKVEEIKSAAKTAYGNGAKAALADGDFAELKADPSLVDQKIGELVDDPVKAEADLTDKGNEIEKESPDWKEKLKSFAEYGAKGLLLLALIGELIPGGGGVVDKLASMAGTAVDKLAKVLYNILSAFLGPIAKTFWDIVKSLKVPLMIIGAVIALVILIYIVKSIKSLFSSSESS